MKLKHLQPHYFYAVKKVLISILLACFLVNSFVPDIDNVEAKALFISASILSHQPLLKQYFSLMQLSEYIARSFVMTNVAENGGLAGKAANKKAPKQQAHKQSKAVIIENSSFWNRIAADADIFNIQGSCLLFNYRFLYTKDRLLSYLNNISMIDNIAPLMSYFYLLPRSGIDDNAVIIKINANIRPAI